MYVFPSQGTTFSKSAPQNKLITSKNIHGANLLLLCSISLENSVCYCYISYEMTDQFYMISGSNEQLQQQLEYTILKPDCHRWWISKMQSRREEERYAIKFCFKLGKNATKVYGMLQTAFGASCMNRAWVFQWHKRFKEGRESVREDERCGRSKEINTPELIGQSVGLGLLCWDFKGVQEEILSEEASTLQIGSVTFPPGQYTSPQHHPCHRLFE